MGQLYGRKGDHASPWLARNRSKFLEFAAAQVPAMLKDLRSLIPLVQDREARRAGTPFLRGHEAHFVPRAGKPVSAELNRALLVWSGKYWLTPLWAIQGALDTVEAWASHRLDVQSIAPIAERDMGEPIFPSWTGRGWDPTTESRSQARDRLREEAEDWIDGYLDAVEQSARDVLETEPLSPIPDRHLQWLADYQVGGLSMTEVARVKGREATRSTVSEAIKKTAAALDLPLRPHNRSGRKGRSK